jgi:Zn-dependent protease with chaperone function
VTTQFFERQNTQRQYTRWLLVTFALALLSVVVIIDLVVVLCFAKNPASVWQNESQLLFMSSLGVIGLVLGASWFKSSELSAGGTAVAKALGGTLVTDNENDFKRKQLLNVVEEMALASRVRKPHVYILEDEFGINAFAAGHSPDDAVIAVTAGALDAFDRAQLQAVIGHEFSHILNGDMKINMRLTALIFGLYVITDLANRVLHSGSGGRRDQRLRLAALGIFIAGSIGMLAGRLVQAGVSRRREYLADASAVQFTRNPDALQGAFVAMAASRAGTRIEHAAADNYSHMFFAGSDAKWVSRFGGSWFATHPPIEERVRAVDSRMTMPRFKALLGEHRRKLAAEAKAQLAAEEAADLASAGNAPKSADGVSGLAAMAPALEHVPMPVAAAATAAPTTAATISSLALAETMPSGAQQVAGRALPPDTLRNRLTAEDQAQITKYIQSVEKSPLTLQAVMIAAMLASEPKKWRVQLTRLASALGKDLMRETQEQIARFALLAPAARSALVVDLLNLLDTLERPDAKRLRAIAKACAPSVAEGDGLRWMVTRALEHRLVVVLKKAPAPPPPVGLVDRAPLVGVLYAQIAQSRFGVGKPGSNAYRAGLFGMLPPPKWAPYPDSAVTHAALDGAVNLLAQLNTTAKLALSEGLVRVIAVGGTLAVAQVDYLRGACAVIGCPLPTLPLEVVYEDQEPDMSEAQASAR